MESGASRDSAHSMKLAGGRVIVDARLLGQSIDQWLTLSHARLPKPRGNRGGAYVRRVVLDPIAGSRQRQAPVGWLGARSICVPLSPADWCVGANSHPLFRSLADDLLD